MSDNKIASTSKVEINITLTLTEVEARALQAMTVYGHEPFLKGFYNKLGRSYMQPHEKGVITLFETIKKEIPKHLAKADEAREAFLK
jgi:hypothetical protein